jgi:peptidoglycan/xylan/chitin deacetylase (PgdA/CDA1 family)
MRALQFCTLALAISGLAMPSLPALADDLNAVCSGNANALGVSRIVEIDTTGGPGFGSEQFKTYDFLQPGEVVLTFDDGPWPGNTPAVLKALHDQCTKAVFFPIGEHTLWHPELLRDVAAAGHTIGSHTWSHANLAKLDAVAAEAEIEKGFSAVQAALHEPGAPFFRFPGLRSTPEEIAYLGQRNIGAFSADFDSQDFKIHDPAKVISSVMTKLQKNGKGIILMHDFQHGTSIALPEILVELKNGGYKIVQVKAKSPVTTLAQFDADIAKQFGGAPSNAPPLASVVRTLDGPSFKDRFSAMR